jgi:hypothetical protein
MAALDDATGMLLAARFFPFVRKLLSIKGGDVADEVD